jgi:hypothetical protein
MYPILTVSGLLAAATLLVGCMAESSDSEAEGSEYSSIEFNIVSQGSQTDVPGGQIIEAKNEDRFTDIWATIPSITGESPNPDFENNQVVFILSRINACSFLEITDVSENESTRLVTVTEVITVNPGLCDPTLEAFIALEYAIVEFELSGLPTSVIYKKRNDF